MKLTKKVLEKEFYDKESKNAYLKACKWVANNIVNVNKSLSKYDLTWDVRRKKDEDVPTFILKVYINIDYDEIKEKHCNICKETHNLFYMNSKQSCNECKLNSYFRRQEEAVKSKIQNIKEILMEVM